jgi:hypothetical protein
MPARRPRRYYPDGRDTAKNKGGIVAEDSIRLTMPPRFPPHPGTRRASISYNIERARFAGDFNTTGDQFALKQHRIVSPGRRPADHPGRRE